MNNVRMNLTQSYQWPSFCVPICAELTKKCDSVTLDRTAGIIFGESEIQRILPVTLGKSPNPG